MLHKPRPEGSSALRRSGGGGSGCKQLERVAGWVSTGIYTAFFTSLDRCACVKIDTIESNMQEPMISRCVLPKGAAEEEEERERSQRPCSTFSIHLLPQASTTSSACKARPLQMFRPSKRTFGNFCGCRSSPKLPSIPVRTISAAHSLQSQDQ